MYPPIVRLIEEINNSTSFVPNSHHSLHPLGRSGAPLVDVIHTPKYLAAVCYMILALVHGWDSFSYFSFSVIAGAWLMEGFRDNVTL